MRKRTPKLSDRESDLAAHATLIRVIANGHRTSLQCYEQFITRYGYFSNMARGNDKQVASMYWDAAQREKLGVSLG